LNIGKLKIGKVVKQIRIDYNDCLYIGKAAISLAQVTFNKLAIRKMQEVLNGPNAEGQMVRLMVDHVHGDHAHYGIILSTKTAHDEVVDVGGLEVLLDRRQLEWLDGTEVKYLLYPQEGWKITNPSKNNHGNH
jgi:iron-sulfur cluster insertion protein